MNGIKVSDLKHDISHFFFGGGQFISIVLHDTTENYIDYFILE